MNIQHTQQDLLAYHAGLYAYLNYGIEQATDTTMQYGLSVIKSKQAYEDFRMHGGVGMFPVRQEGAQIFMDNVPKRFSFRVFPVIHSMGLGYTKQAEFKDVYGFIKSQGPMMGKAAVLTKNYMAALAFMNNAFPGGSSTGPDGLTLFNANHTTVGATVQNNYDTSLLSPFALENALQKIDAQTTDRDDLPNDIQGKFTLMTGTLNNAQAFRIVKSDKLAGSNVNDTNEYLQGRIGSIKLDKFINYGMTTMANAWALFPENKNENKLIELFIQDYRVVVDELKSVDSLAMYGHFENLYTFLDWKGTWGSKP